MDEAFRVITMNRTNTVKFRFAVKCLKKRQLIFNFFYFYWNQVSISIRWLGSAYQKRFLYGSFKLKKINPNRFIIFFNTEQPIPFFLNQIRWAVFCRRATEHQQTSITIETTFFKSKAIGGGQTEFKDSLLLGTFKFPFKVYSKT